MLLVLLAVFFADPGPDPGPKLSCEFLRGKGDTFSDRPTPAGHELTFGCHNKIGRARVKVVAGELPGVVVVRLTGLGALEGLTLTDGKWTLNGGVNVEGRPLGSAVDRDGKPTDDPKAAAVTLAVVRKKDVYEATVTYAPGVKPGKDLSLQWIEHYLR